MLEKSDRSVPMNLTFGVGGRTGTIGAKDLILDDQDCFDSKEGWQELLHLIPEKSVQNTLREKWSKSERSSQAKWADLRAEVKALTKGSQPRVCDPDPFLLFFES